MEGGSQLENTDNYGEAGYADGPSGCAGGVGRGRYWLDVKWICFQVSDSHKTLPLWEPLH